MSNIRKEFLNEVVPELIAEDTTTKYLQAEIDQNHKLIDIHDDSISSLWSAIPSKISQLENDSNFLSESKIAAKYARIVDIPTKVSELTNDSEFITSTVQNLTNYYLKSETYSKDNIYSKDEINFMFATLSTMSVLEVDALPTEKISTTTIYLLKIDGDENNTHEEYLYVNNKWELIGNTKIDLSDYIKKGDNVSELTNDAGYLTSHQDISGKQDKLTAGTNITIENNVISATTEGGTSYTAGDNINISDDNVISATVPTKTSELTNDSTYVKEDDVAKAKELASTLGLIIIPTGTYDADDIFMDEVTGDDFVYYNKYLDGESIIKTGSGNSNKIYGPAIISYSRTSSNEDGMEIMWYSLDGASSNNMIISAVWNTSTSKYTYTKKACLTAGDVPTIFSEITATSANMFTLPASGKSFGIVTASSTTVSATDLDTSEEYSWVLPQGSIVTGKRGGPNLLISTDGYVRYISSCSAAGSIRYVDIGDLSTLSKKQDELDNLTIYNTTYVTNEVGTVIAKSNTTSSLIKITEDVVTQLGGSSYAKGNGYINENQYFVYWNSDEATKQLPVTIVQGPAYLNWDAGLSNLTIIKDGEIVVYHLDEDDEGTTDAYPTTHSKYLRKEDIDLTIPVKLLSVQATPGQCTEEINILTKDLSANVCYSESTWGTTESLTFPADTIIYGDLSDITAAKRTVGTNINPYIVFPDGTIYDIKKVTLTTFMIVKRNQEKITYSTDEVDTGKTWIDGSEIYRKVVDLGTLPDSTYKEISTGLSGSGKVIKMESYAYSSSLGATIYIPQVSTEGLTSQVTISFYYSKVIVTTASNFASWTGYAIIEYIKTA